ncbi:MAG: c-type cytochrome [Planctomycetes bacterium]|nr:c-type cytochrome [Planctomycetota bacterium]
MRLPMKFVFLAGAASIWAAASLTSFSGDLVPSPERPGNSSDDPIQKPKDLSGRSIKCPRVRAVSAGWDGEEGTTGWLFKNDPWMAYQRGREEFVREFSAVDGAFGEPGKMAGPVLEDEATHLATRDHVASCTLCHNTPFRDGGSGATFFKNGGTGRNTPHAFGSGLVESLGWQLRLMILEKGDLNRDGWIAKGEADRVRAVVENLPNGDAGEHVSVDFGYFGDLDGNGKPDLNPICLIIYVDKDGKRISWARKFSDEGVAGYTIEFQIFGWGHRKGSVASSLRAFSANAYDMHTGLQAYDPILSEEPNNDGLAQVSVPGMPQFITGRTRDRGVVKDARGVSKEDPDRDGVLEEITSGDMDLIEWYQLNHPSPAEKLRTAQASKGRKLMTSAGCTACHVPDWNLQAGDATNPDYTKRYVGDRRFFDLDVKPNPETGRLEGKVSRRDPLRRPAFAIRGVYSDFAHHDMGPAFYQMQFDGSILKKFRTAPLWGVGTTAPYGHDGASLDLDEVIRRHGGEADASQKAYAAMDEEDREAVLAFLRGLVLYSCDDIPCDVDGDGKISEKFIVAGQDTGVERLNPEWLFRVPGRIEGMVVNPDGVKVKSCALTNAEDAYGMKLKWLRDDDRDGFPDARFAGMKK